MSNLLSKVLNKDWHNESRASTVLKSVAVAQLLNTGACKDITFTVSGTKDSLPCPAFDRSAAVEVYDPTGQAGPVLLEQTTDSSITILVDPDLGVPIRYSYVPGNLGRLNRELGISTDSATVLLQWPGLVGSFQEKGLKRLDVSSSISILIEGNGSSGELEPDDPGDIPDEPHDPGDDPGTVVAGGLKEVSVVVNPNSMYTIKLQAVDGVEITGVEGLDLTMSWNQVTKTLTGGVLGPVPKKVIVKLGQTSTDLYIRAEPISRHLI